MDLYTLWTAFLTIGAIPYLGVPFQLRVGQGKPFLFVHLNALASVFWCKVSPVAIEYHWSLIAERYHEPLRLISHKRVTKHPAAPRFLNIDYVNLEMLHTIKYGEFTLTILAFGTQPRLPIGDFSQ